MKTDDDKYERNVDYETEELRSRISPERWEDKKRQLDHYVRELKQQYNRSKGI